MTDLMAQTMNKLDELEALRVECGLSDTPTPQTANWRWAVSGQGPDAATWSDKPHRLLYDACSYIEALARQSAEQAARVVELEAALRQTINLAEAYSEGTGELYRKGIDKARAALDA